MAIITKIEGGGTPAVPRISFAEPEPTPVYGPPAPTQTDRALEVWQVEDRRTYWENLKELQQQVARYTGPTPSTVQPQAVDDLSYFQRQAYNTPTEPPQFPTDLGPVQAGAQQYTGPTPSFLGEQARLTQEAQYAGAPWSEFGFASHADAIRALTNPSSREELQRAVAY